MLCSWGTVLKWALAISAIASQNAFVMEFSSFTALRCAENYRGKLRYI
jgi:hypothetical protein